MTEALTRQRSPVGQSGRRPPDSLAPSSGVALGTGNPPSRPHPLSRVRGRHGRCQPPARRAWGVLASGVPEGGFRDVPCIVSRWLSGQSRPPNRHTRLGPFKTIFIDVPAAHGARSTVARTSDPRPLGRTRMDSWLR